VSDTEATVVETKEEEFEESNDELRHGHLLELTYFPFDVCRRQHWEQVADAFFERRQRLLHQIPPNSIIYSIRNSRAFLIWVI
jgi:hypothetical protein